MCRLSRSALTGIVVVELASVAQSCTCYVASMTFDPRYKELARAHDAVDRLRDVHDRIAERAQRETARREAVIRIALVAALAWLVIEACLRL